MLLSCNSQRRWGLQTAASQFNRKHTLCPSTSVPAGGDGPQPQAVNVPVVGPSAKGHVQLGLGEPRLPGTQSLARASMTCQLAGRGATAGGGERTLQVTEPGGTGLPGPRLPCLGTQLLAAVATACYRHAPWV